MADTAVIETRLQKLDSVLRGLRPLQQLPLDEYLADEDLQLIVERRLQLAIQACIDIANHLVARLGTRIPDEQEDVFRVLAAEGLLPAEAAERMVGTVRFRNILVHDYLAINNRLVHQHLAQRLADFDVFAREVAERYLTSR